jgi:16S rRNA (cytosine967-C5)-methyltransferase
VRQQRRLLEALWPLLVPGGMLEYCTCSVLHDENTGQLQAFLGAHADARELPIEVSWGHACTVGRQLLPGEQDMDGFYYACIQKQG